MTTYIANSDDIERKLSSLRERVEGLEKLTTGEDGYMLISVPTGSYVLPPKEVNKQIKLKLKDDGETKSAGKLFTKEDMTNFAVFCAHERELPNEKALDKWIKYQP